ncbi:trehalose synthase [Parelusimicrobium proximum]|uniref:glycosyltransferase n=1 Tax=Parelusimicrobium proximum TaxID=3228953 RepID=UPI003D16CA4E
MRLEDYKVFTGEDEIHNIKFLFRKIEGIKTRVISSYPVNGGAREELKAFESIMAGLGGDFQFVSVSMPDEYIKVCRHFEEVCVNPMEEVTDEDLLIYNKYKNLAAEQARGECDLLISSDFPVLSVIEDKFYKKAVWRSHSNFKNISPKLFDFIKEYVNRYDMAMFSLPSFFGKFDTRQTALMPAIDPLSDKNKPLPEAYINSVFAKYGINRDKKVIMQIGRFEDDKDPKGMIEIFRDIKQRHDVALVLAGGDYEGRSDIREYNELVEMSKGIDDLYIVLMPHNDVEINALQRGADIIVQKPKNEGFGVVVMEALWKRKPVVVSDVGGLPLQVQDGVTGLVCPGKKSCISQLEKLISDPAGAKALAEAGHNDVKQNFLITRHIKELFTIINQVYKGVQN